ncbi:MAG: NAD(+) synthase [Thermoplasmatota archaeon]
MGRLPLAPSFEPEMTETICRFIERRVRQARAAGVVLGVSGGLDSTVVGALCARALGRERVLGLLMPEREPEPEATVAIGWLRVPYKIVPIRGIVERVLEAAAAGGPGAGGGGRKTAAGAGAGAGVMGPGAGSGRRAGGGGGAGGGNSVETILGGRRAEGGEFWGRRGGGGRVAEGNVKARVRMLLLYLEANRSGRLVVGTGNKSEILTGYFTKYGDGAADLMPIGDLYKTQVREMAAGLGVPERIRALAPSAGLYPGQTDEAELGVPYETLDRILLGLELGLGPEELVRRTGARTGDIERVMRMVEAGVHKRLLPPIPKLGIRTVGLDWREELLHPDD